MTDAPESLRRLASDLEPGRFASLEDRRQAAAALRRYANLLEKREAEEARERALEEAAQIADMVAGSWRSLADPDVIDLHHDGMADGADHVAEVIRERLAALRAVDTPRGGDADAV